MSNVKQGTLARATEWWVHLRAEKRTFWKRERKAHAAAIRQLDGLIVRHVDSLVGPINTFEGRKPTSAELGDALRELEDAKLRPTVWVDGREYYELWPAAEELDMQDPRRC